jgi:hypothetical protein
MNKLLEAALQYEAKGFSVIPAAKDKKPLTKWELYQSRRATPGEIKSWWSKMPDANIGLVTGEISNLLVVDTDTVVGINRINDAIPDGLLVPCERTPRGGKHFFFSHQDGFVNRAKVAEGIDVRTKGGFIIVAPSINGNGREWQWMDGLSLFEVKVPSIPDAVKEIIKALKKDLYIGDVDKSVDSDPKTSTTVYMFEEGRRDDDLFHTANCLVKGGAKPIEISQILRVITSSWGEQDEKWIRTKIDSAMKRAERKERNLSDEVKDWVCLQSGYFLSTECQQGLQLSTREDKKNLSIILKRLCDQRVIERYGEKSGSFRKIETDIELINWENADDSILSLQFPFEIERLVSIMPKNILVIAGIPNAGKGHPYSTPIMTPEGWNNIENLKIGDTVAAGDGSWTKLNGVFHRGPQQIFRVEFSDKTWIECDYEHLWSVQREHGRSRVKKWDILPTYALLARPYFRYTGRLQIPRSGVVHFPERKVPIDPYTLGVLLGDGSLSRSTPNITTLDSEIIKRVNLHHEISKIKKTNKNNRCPSYGVLGITSYLRDLGLFGKRSWEKHIPLDYLLNSYQNQILILRGLMDTGGTVSKTGKSVSFTSTSQRLAEDVIFLIRSLGEKAVMGKVRRTYFRYNGEKKRGRESYTIHISIKGFNPFFLNRKAVRVTPFRKRNNKVITAIVPVGIKDSICLSVEHPDGLYIAKDFIVTHNTAFLLNFARMNMDKWPILYFSSEMDGPELKARLKKFEGPLKQWRKVGFYKKEEDFANALNPDGVNIIDFLEITDKFYLIAERLREYHKRLNKGVLFVAIQKDPQKEYGRGGGLGLEKPRLYLTMDRGKMKILKGKTWASEQNPEGMQTEFKIIQGAKFITQDDWKSPEWKQEYKNSRFGNDD